jgi:site-specific DNA-methyltransferase (adenine-specific)
MDDKTKALMFSSKTGEHGTPQDFFDQLHNEFYFDRDVAAHHLNAKCPEHFGEQEDGSFIDGLEEAWGEEGDIVYCNPPYGREITDWLLKGVVEKKEGVSTVFLLPARTDTKWFHDIVIPNASEICFIRGRLKFEGMEAGAPFPSLLVIFWGDPQNDTAVEVPEQKYKWSKLQTGS